MKVKFITRLVLFIMVMFANYDLYAQRENINSLQKSLPRLRDTARVDCLNDLSCMYVAMENKDSSIYFADLAYSHARPLNYIAGIANFFFLKSAIARHFDDDFKKSETFGEEALAWFEKTSNKKGIDGLYFRLWDAHYAQGLYDEARYYAQKSYEWSRQIPDQTAMIRPLQTIAFTYYQQGDFERTFFYLQQAHQIVQKGDNQLNKSNDLFLFATLYRAIGDNETALNYFRQVIRQDNSEIEKQRVNMNLDIWVKTAFAELLAIEHQYDSALYYYNLFDTLNMDTKYLRVYLSSVGEYYLLRGNYDKALYSFFKALVYHQNLNDISQIIRTQLGIARAYLSFKNSNAAMKYVRKALDNALQAKARHSIRDAYEIMYRSYDLLHQTDSGYNYYRKYIVIKEDVTNAQIKGRLAAYGYEQKIELLKKEKQIQTITLQRESILKKFMIFGFVILLILAAIVFRNIILKRRNEKLKSERLQQQLKQKVSELEMQALRAQMNPHFIFNSLNSINRFILQNNKAQASEYLTKFSRLVRLILQNSQAALIPLESELESLQLYLELEAVRFDHHFQFRISVADDIETDIIKVPPLIIQPYAENAIWHGLMHKEEKGHLEIELFKQNEILCCRITDDGIGRKKASELKSKSAATHKSIGMKITADRIAILQNLNGSESPVTINDLINADGSAGGTEVLLKITAML